MSSRRAISRTLRSTSLPSAPAIVVRWQRPHEGLRRAACFLARAPAFPWRNSVPNFGHTCGELLEQVEVLQLQLAALVLAKVVVVDDDGAGGGGRREASRRAVGVVAGTGGSTG